MRGCKGKCDKISGVVSNLGRFKYNKLGDTDILCRPCGIIIPISHKLMRFDILGGRRCMCCGSKLSCRIKNKKAYRTQLEVEGLIKRY